MSSERIIHEKLVGRMLAEHETRYAAAPEGSHPDDDTLALFAEGRLSAAELDPLVRHLADCGPCRAKAGLLMIASDDSAELSGLPPVIRWFQRPAAQVLALAAGLLLCVTGYVLVQQQRESWAENAAYRAAEQLLADGRFDEAKAAVDKAQEDDVTSARLDSIAAQALRRIPAAVALASAGKLTDLGIGIGGVVAREPSPAVSDESTRQAKKLLDSAARDHLEAALNRGHLLMQLNEPAQARDQFQEVVERYPDQPLAWLGLGNAQYLLGEYATAAESFRRSLALDPSRLAARINLAMAYDETGDSAKAMRAWKDLLGDPSARLSDDERSQIEAHVRTLEPAR